MGEDARRGHHGTMSNDELGQIEQRIWRELQAAGERGHPWRLMTLATVTPDGGPDARSVVLRRVDAEHRELYFYTDTRSPKVGQIAAHPKGAIVMWSPALGWQLRIQVDMEVMSSGLAVLSAWAQVKLTPAVFDYLSPVPPGSPLSRPSPERGSREHFAVVCCRVRSIDWLDLNTDGQRRARFGPSAGEAVWLQP